MIAANQRLGRRRKKGARHTYTVVALPHVRMVLEAEKQVVLADRGAVHCNLRSTKGRSTTS